MLGLGEAVVLVHFQHQRVFALVPAALVQQLLLHLRGRAAVAALVQLAEIVAEAEPAAGPGLDQKVQQIHDALRTFVEGEGAGVGAAELFEQAAALGVFAREEAVEQEARQVEAGDRQRRDRRAAAGHADHRDAGLYGGADQLVARVGDAGRARVGDDGDAFACEHLADEVLGLAVLVEFVVRHQLVADAQQVQQHHRAAGVLGCDDVDIRQDLDAAGRHIPRIADGRGDNIEFSGLLIHAFPLPALIFSILYHAGERFARAENMAAA